MRPTTPVRRPRGLTRVTATGNAASPASAVDDPRHLRRRTCNDFPAGTDCLPSEQPSHSVGNVKVAPDGTLFVTTGDGASFNVVDDDCPALAGPRLRSPARCCTSPPPGKGIAEQSVLERQCQREPIEGLGLRAEKPVPARPGSGVGRAVSSATSAGAPGRKSTPSTRRGQRQFRLALLRRVDLVSPATQPQGRRVRRSMRSDRAPCRCRRCRTTTAPAAPRSPAACSTPAPRFRRSTAACSSTPTTRSASCAISTSTVRARWPGRSPASAIGLNGPVYLDTDGQNLLYLSIISGRASADPLHRRRSGRQLSERQDADVRSERLGPVRARPEQRREMRPATAASSPSTARSTRRGSACTRRRTCAMRWAAPAASSRRRRGRRRGRTAAASSSRCSGRRHDGVPTTAG